MAFKRGYTGRRKNYKRASAIKKNVRRATAKRTSERNLKKFAYQLGRVKAGLGGDTQVADAYKRGLNAKSHANKRKPLI